MTEVNTTEDLHSLLNDSAFDFRFTCGYSNYVLFSPHAELEQLRTGFLETLQVERLLCLHDDKMRALLAYSPLFDVTVEYLLDAFVIRYSLDKSNNRTKEEAISIHWFEYISNCKGILISNFRWKVCITSKYSAVLLRSEQNSCHWL